jgi:CheY-like chemotaxis protein
VLLVEDNSMVRQTAARMLESLGYGVSEAADGASAIDKLLAEPEIEVMFTDVVMPGGMTGWDLAETAWKIRPGLKVLFTTGYTDNPILQKAEADRRLHVLQKPYRKQELARMLREVIAE